MIRVVTVCTANLCRSPFAAALLDRWFAGRGVEVRSGGVAAVPGSTPPGGWVRTCRRHGVDLAGHRAVPAADVVHDADLVLAMTAAHCRELALEFPSVVDRLTTLGAAVTRARAGGVSTVADLAGASRARDLLQLGETDDVADPVGRMPWFQRRVADHLVALTDALVARWPR